MALIIDNFGKFCCLISSIAKLFLVSDSDHEFTFYKFLNLIIQ